MPLTERGQLVFNGITEKGDLVFFYDLTSKGFLVFLDGPQSIISVVTLQGNRQLHVILQGQRDLHIVLQGGVDVPAINQNFTLEAGTDKIIDIPNIVDSIAALDLTTCQGVYYEAKRGNQVISKNLTNGITVTSPTNLSIALVPADTHGFMGSFPHEVWCVDSNGKKCVLTKGNLTISPSYADVP